MDTTYQNKNKTPPKAEMEASKVKLTKQEMQGWAEMVYGKGSLNAYIPNVKLVQNCIYCKEEMPNQYQHNCKK